MSQFSETLRTATLPLRRRFRFLRTLIRARPWFVRGIELAEKWQQPSGYAQQQLPPNPLEAFFEANREGPGIWKWKHYFDIYHRHLAKFRGRAINILEIGIYSGGSLRMWKDYFGPRCRIYGIDIEDSCRIYEDNSTKVFIGDQADRGFLASVRASVPMLDIIIDDGGHLTEQQATTIEELLPHMQPGGVYMCEDVHGVVNDFGAFVSALTQALDQCRKMSRNHDNCERASVCPTTPFQSAVHSIHCYPFLKVVEMRDSPVTELVAPKHGTEWQPFL